MFDSFTAQPNKAHTNLEQNQTQSTAWLNSERTPYKLPVNQKQQMLHLEPEAVLGRRNHKLDGSIANFDNFKSLEKIDRAQSATQVLKLLKAEAKNSNIQSTDRDSLTGLTRTQSIAGEPKSAIAGSSFNSAYGYGLVNAAKAVAWAAGYYPYALPEVSDQGGLNWSNDMVKAPEAWNWGATGQGVTVAVIDSGVDITHPDLNDNIWRNAGEIAGDGIDNDRNGYVDDVVGWNFATDEYNNNVLPGTTDPGQSHGTHVAGTIAAEANEFGTTGVAPNAKIMALRIADVSTAADGKGYFANSGNLAEAIYYAVNNGAKVINMSLGWSEDPQVTAALAYAASRNVITVSAAGNEAEISPGNPAKFATDYGISVGSVDEYGNLASTSNQAGYDSRMQHVVAPGVDIVSTTPLDDHTTDWYGYDTQNGTSMAAPHVAGVVALMLSVNRNLTHAEVRYILTQSASSYGYSNSLNSISAVEREPMKAIAHSTKIPKNLLAA